VTLTVRPEAVVDARIRDMNSLERQAESLDDVVRRVARVGEDDVAVRRLSRGCGVHAHRPRMQVLRKAERAEVVDHRRAPAGALGRHHPVGEVHDVEVAEKLLRGRAPERAPCAPGRVREWDREEALLDL